MATINTTATTHDDNDVDQCDEGVPSPGNAEIEQNAPQTIELEKVQSVSLSEHNEIAPTGTLGTDTAMNDTYKCRRKRR